MMNKNFPLYFLILLIVFTACNKKSESALDIVQKTINAIDTIETIYYKQDMLRSNPRNPSDSMFRFREMYFKRHITDSIVGLKGHWYMYVNDKENIIYEDIYDGHKLIRRNNRDSVARVYDLVKYPEFKRKHFWSHNTLYGLQYEFRYMLAQPKSFLIHKLNDTILANKDCYQIAVKLEDKMTMPGFATELKDNEGSISKTFYFIDKETHYPIKIKAENYSRESPEQKIFMEQSYYDIHFNLKIDEQIQFNTSNESIIGFEKREMKPE